MLISIVTASYNYENYIKETIESVIAQTYTNWEMIIVDDGSKDNSVEVIKSYCEKDSRIKLYQHEGGVNKGLVETVKLGIEKAKGEWIAFLESDDSIVPEYLEEKFKVLEQNSDVNFIFNDVNMFGNNEIIEKYNKHFAKSKEILSQYSYPANLLKHFLKINLVPTFSAVMIKKEILIQIDYDVAFKPLLDWYLWSQLAKNNKFYYLDKKLTNWRMHKGSYISVKQTIKEEFNWNRQLHKVINNNSLLFDILYAFNFIRKQFVRIHFRTRRICLLGKWYQFGERL